MKAFKFGAAALCVMAMAVVLGPVGCAGAEAEEGEEDLTRVIGVDHAAMVEVSTVMLTADTFTLIRDENLDNFNREDPFKIEPDRYRFVFEQHFAHFDGYDRKADWSPAQSKYWLARVSSGNFQILDASKPCVFGTHTYLDVERGMLTGKPHQTCGGRMPNDDALDAVMTWLVRGPATAVDSEDAVSDGVSQATKLATDTFPYLAEPN